jgi:hypothetical protein
MQYKMLNEVLEVFESVATDPRKEKVNALFDALKEMHEHGELTVKQRRVLNCLCTVQQGEAQRLERSKRIKQVS